MQVKFLERFVIKAVLNNYFNIIIGNSYAKLLRKSTKSLLLLPHENLPKQLIVKTASWIVHNSQNTDGVARDPLLPFQNTPSYYKL